MKKLLFIALVLFASMFALTSTGCAQKTTETTDSVVVDSVDTVHVVDSVAVDSVVE